MQSFIKRPPARIPILLSLMLATAEISKTATLDFESRSDGDIIISHYPGLTFSNTIALAANASLNEFEFPPHSGRIAISDDGGPISIAFADPILSISGYFTYLQPVTIKAFDSSGALLDSTASAFFSNVGLSGDSGSTPNEFLMLVAPYISTVTIGANEFGGSFTLDDLSYTSAPLPIPEPNSSALTALGIVLTLILRKRISNKRIRSYETHTCRCWRHYSTCPRLTSA